VLNALALKAGEDNSVLKSPLRQGSVIANDQKYETIRRIAKERKCSDRSAPMRRCMVAHVGGYCGTFNMMVARKHAAALSGTTRRLTRFSIVAVLLVVAHIASLLVFGHSPTVVILSDFLTLVSALFTAIVCFSASRGSYALARPFWQLTSITFVLWSLGKSLLMYNFYYLGITTVPIAPLLIFFFSAAPIFVTTFLSEDDLRDTINWEGILDAVHILVLIVTIYLFVIYIPLLTKGEQAVGRLEASDWCL
jgi:hypothetical protein